MENYLLFEGKITMAGTDVDIKIYRVEDNGLTYYRWDYNPYLVDVNQIDVHNGAINFGNSLEEILYRINMYNNEIKEIKKIVPNPNF